ncbi:T9SS type A sorting domain-containing protein [Marinoscillum pacificum]|uniref:T9SS type A sorting domain-containing protein n=1 Tax=Marinoscillum pacificum TaxID=392723 RepID=UPI0021584EEA|nr:T9SS type A sorting domain-containing protein [Marinoscillum pacificum]
MNKVLFKQTLSAMLFLLGMGMARAQSVSYQQSFSLQDGASYEGFASIVGKNDLYFTTDGTKLFTLNNSRVTQYTVTNPHDIASGITQDGFYTITEETGAQGVTFSRDGLKMFLTGYSTGAVHQYTLSTAFDVTSTVTYAGSPFDVTAQDTAPYDVAFSSDGMTMFIMGFNGDDINQYSLTSAFDITSGVTVEGSPFSYASEDGNARGFEFSDNGEKLFLTGFTGRVYQYNLDTPYDLTGTVSLDDNTILVSGDVATPLTLTFSGDGSRMYIIELSLAKAHQYQFPIGTFSEVEINDGTIGSSAAVQITGDLFSNAGGTLTHGVEFTISNIPSGLNPSLAVGDNGTYGILTLTGSATDHQNINDVASLEFTFANSAFEGGDASAVTNAIAASSGIAVDFDDNNPAIRFGAPFELNLSILEATGSVTGNFTSMTFNDDGTRLYCTTNFDRVYEVVLSTPYDIAGGISLGDNLLVSEFSSLAGVEFNEDGSKMFLLNQSTAELGEYTLSSPYDITTAVFVTSFDISSVESNPYAFTFNSSGSKLYFGGYNSDQIHQFSLTSSFDLSSTITNDGSPLSIKSYEEFIYDMEFGDNGSKLYITGSSSDKIHEFDLETPFDITASVEFSHTLNVSGQSSAPVAVLFSENGGKLLMLGYSGYKFSQYDLGLNGFSETEENNGEVEGELVVYAIDETFTNAGGTLSYSTDYDLGNVPAGLTPNMTVSADGTFATLTFSGSASSHQEINDVSSIGFDFAASAFTGGNDADVANANKAESGIGVYFEDNYSFISYGYAYSLENGAEFSTYFNPSDDDTNIQGLAFNDDGSKMYVVGNTGNAILQYTLGSPYEIGGAITLEGSFDVSSYDGTPTDVMFNPAGTKMYLAGNDNDKVYQFSLSTPFDVTTGVTYDETPFDGASYPNSITFNDDGSMLYVFGGISSSSGVFQYELNTPYDITAGLDYVTKYTIGMLESNPRGMAFSDNGFIMFLVGLNDVVYCYSLSKPFDLKSTVTQIGTFDMNSYLYSANGLVFNASGTKMYVSSVQSSVCKITEFTLNAGGFVESATNDGSVEGSIVLRAFDAQFANAGSTLTNTTDYTVTGISAGLTPTITVAADGFSATLTLSGNATNHQNIHDVEDLVFTLTSSAFVSDFSLIDNVSGISSDLGIDFNNNNPIILYGNAFDITDGATYSGSPVSVSAEESNVTGVSFSTDGTKMFIVGADGDEVNQYSLTTAFDISAGVTSDGSPFDISTQEGTASGITFSSHGMKMFISGDDGSDIYQYSLTSSFDITSGVTFDGSYFSPHDNSPQGVEFSVDGFRMFILGSVVSEVNQYSLANAFDITSGVTFETNFSVSGEETSPRDLAFSPDGSKMLIVGASGRDVTQYELTAPFNLSTGVTVGSTYNFASATTNPRGFCFNSDGDRFYVTDAGAVYQFDIEIGGFNEVDLNDGFVEGSVTITIVDNQFANAGGTLTPTTDYVITNLPSGLSPTMTVAADGLSAELTISGQVTDHQEVNSLESLVFTFDDSAFGTYKASFTTNAMSASSNISLNFRDNKPELIYGYYYDFENVSFDGLFSVSAQDDIPTNLAFSEDGMTLFLTGRRNDAIYQYSLTNPLDITSGVSYIGMLDISNETVDAMDLEFSPDGLTLLVLSDNVSSSFGSLIAQYDLTEAFDITTGVTYSGNTYDLSAAISHPSGFTFNDDGTKVFITNGFHTNERIYYYALTAPYDISGGLTPEGNLLYEVESESLYDLSFNADGTSLFVLRGALTDRIDELKLAAPYDLTGTVDLGQSYSVSSQEEYPQGFIFSPKGDKMFVVGTTGDEINQYNLTNEGFVENSSNDGTIDGALTIRLIDDFFANAGGTLSYSTDYSISNIPSGLSPVLTVAADGLTAELTFSGSSSSHLDSDDIGGLIFSFENSAFENTSASDVAKASSYQSFVGIDFNTMTWDGAEWLFGTPGAGSDDVIIDGDYNTADDGLLEVNSLVINSGKTLTVAPDNYLYVVGDITNNGSLIVESGADLMSFESGNFSGNDVIIKRNTRYADGRYSFVGTPVQQTSNVTNSTLGSHVYAYDETQSFDPNDGLDRWLAVSGELIPGVGYTQASQQEIVFEGIPNVGTVNVAGTYTGTYDDATNEENEGWVFVSNPYATAIDVADFLAQSNIEGAVYIWDDNGSDTGRGTNSDYIIANGTVATNTTPAGGQSRFNGSLGSAQGFFVKLADDVDTEITFTPGMRVTGSNADENFFRSEGIPAYVRVNLTNAGGLFKQAVVGKIGGINDEVVDRSFDAKVFSSNGADMIYTKKGDHALAIQGISYDREAVPLAFNVAKAGVYSIDLDLSNANGEHFFLKDNYTGKVVNLSSESYSFTSNAGQFVDRFELLANGRVLGDEESKLQVYAHDQTIYFKLANGSGRQLELIDMNGQKLWSKMIKESTEIETSLPAGIYLIMDGERTHKILLK